MTPSKALSVADSRLIDIDFNDEKKYMTGLEALGYLTFVRTYAKEGETFEDTINRYLDFFKKRYPHMTKKINYYGHALHQKLAIGSMRMMQFAGPAVEHENFRAYNCSFTSVSDFKDFSDILYLLCCGAGVGVSVESKYIEKLPIITEGEEDIWVIPDTKEGWADSIEMLCKNPKLQFDYSLIRLEGAPLSSGGTASGPEPLRKSHVIIRHILKKANGRRLSAEDVADIACLIAQCVVAGGVRRSSIIILFDTDSMMKYKNLNNYL